MLLKRRTQRRGLDEFAAYLEYELQRSTATIKNYVGALTRFAAFCGMDLEDIRVPDARRYLYSDASIATKKIAVVAVHQFEKWMIYEGRPPTGLAELPVPRYKPAKLPPLDPTNTLLLLTAPLTPRIARAVYFGLYAGCRVGESARMSETNVRGDRLTFIGSKTGKERSVPLHPDLEGKLDYIFSSPVSRDVLVATFCQFRDRLGVVDLKGDPAKTHSLRRTFSDYLYNVAKTPWEVVATVLGHDLGVTGRYPDIHFERTQAPVLSVDYFANAPGQMTLFA